jgi:hypothetical protein
MGIVPTDDLISLLAQDHEAIKERFSELGHADPDVRGQLFWELMDQLVRHEVAEEVVDYPPRHTGQRAHRCRRVPRTWRQRSLLYRWRH